MFGVLFIFLLSQLGALLIGFFFGVYSQKETMLDQVERAYKKVKKFKPGTVQRPDAEELNKTPMDKETEAAMSELFTKLGIGKEEK